jgi:hypothetical protein
VEAKIAGQPQALKHSSTQALERCHAGREDRVLELKKGVDDLLIQAGHLPRYTIAVEEDEK